jgi:predicted alpha/beta-fold hydrolase
MALSDPYLPPRWLRNGHCNTIASYLLPREVELPQPRDELIDVEPGVRVLLRCNWQPDVAPALLLVHGLEGSADAGYMLTTADKALRRGWHALRLNIRNCGDTERYCSTLYNSGLSGDVARVVEWALARPQVAGVALCGFSMGGNMVLKYAGECADNAPAGLASVAAVSACLDLAPSADALHRRRNFIYEQRFLRSLRRRLLRKARLEPGRYPIHRLRGVRSIREFDDVITAPAMGYRDAADYYHRASAARVLDRIAVPTLAIHAEDDPFVIVTPEAREVIARNSNIIFLNTRHGGHCSFIQATGHGEDRYWAENRVLDFVTDFRPTGVPSAVGKGLTTVGFSGIGGTPPHSSLVRRSATGLFFPRDSPRSAGA